MTCRTISRRAALLGGGAVLFATGFARADPDKDESGRGRHDLADRRREHRRAREDYRREFGKMKAERAREIRHLEEE